MSSWFVRRLRNIILNLIMSMDSFFCIILGLELSEFKQVQNNYVSDKLIFLTFETDQFLFLAM